MKKILLSIFAIFTIAFMTTNVKAEEVTLNENTLDGITGVNVQLVEYDFENHDNWRSTIGTAVKNELTTSGISLGDNNELKVDEKWNENSDGSINYDIHKAVISIRDNSQTSTINGNEFPYKVIAQKEINVTYSNTANYNNTDKQALENKSLLLNSDIYKYYPLGTDIDFTQEDLNKIISEIINDNTIKVFYDLGMGYDADKNMYGYSGEVRLYKNDVLYVQKHNVDLYVGYGFTLDNNSGIAIMEIDSNENSYSDMKKILNSDGYNNIIGSYELKLNGTHSGNIKVPFKVGEKYNGKEVRVLHKKSNNTYETFDVVVKNGIAEVEVSELSPFMIALKDNTATNVNNAPNNAQTSSMSVILYIVLALGSLTGIIYLIVSKKKKMA